MPTLDRFFFRLAWVFIAAALLMVLWRWLPYLESLFIRAPDATPRAVLARGELASDERSTIEPFGSTISMPQWAPK